MAYIDPEPGGFGSSDNPDLSNQWKIDRYNQWKNSQQNNRPSTSSYSSFTPSTNFNDILKQTQQMYQQSIAPVISSLESQIGNTQQSYAQAKSLVEAQKEPLQQRYDALIESLKGKQQLAEQSQTKVTSQEYAKRGIPLSSTIYGQDLQNALLPIQTGYAGDIAQSQYQRESDLLNIAQMIANLTGQESSALGDIRTNIANVQSGVTPQATQLAMQLLQNQQAENARLAAQSSQDMFSGIGQGYTPQIEQKPVSSSASVKPAQQQQTLQKATYLSNQGLLQPQPLATYQQNYVPPTKTQSTLINVANTLRNWLGLPVNSTPKQGSW